MQYADCKGGGQRLKKRHEKKKNQPLLSSGPQHCQFICPKFMAPSAPIVLDEDIDYRKAGLKPVAFCKGCGRLSLSEIVICKGSNTPINKGKRYQVVCTLVILPSRRDNQVCPNSACIISHTAECPREALKSKRSKGRRSKPVEKAY